MSNTTLSDGLQRIGVDELEVEFDLNRKLIDYWGLDEQTVEHQLELLSSEFEVGKRLIEIGLAPYSGASEAYFHDYLVQKVKRQSSRNVVRYFAFRLFFSREAVFRARVILWLILFALGSIVLQTIAILLELKDPLFWFDVLGAILIVAYILFIAPSMIAMFIAKVRAWVKGTYKSIEEGIGDLWYCNSPVGYSELLPSHVARNLEKLKEVFGDQVTVSPEWVCIVTESGDRKLIAGWVACGPPVGRQFTVDHWELSEPIDEPVGLL